MSTRRRVDSKIDIEKVKGILRYQGRSQKWLAKRCVLEAHSMRMILTELRNPSGSVIDQMAQALGVPREIILRKAS